MRVLYKNVAIKRESPEYSGLLVSVSSDESSYGRVLAIGPDVTTVNLNDKVIVNWREVKIINGDAYLIDEDKILAVLDD